MRRVAVIAATFAAIVAAGVQAQPPLPDLHAADVEVVLADGRTATLADLVPVGKPVVVEFWATWCAPCRKMARGMKALHDDYAARGLTILALTIERPDRDGEKVLRYVESAGIPYTVGFAPEGFYESMTGRTSRSVPKVFIFDGEGRLVRSIETYTPLTNRQIKRTVAGLFRRR